MLAEFEKKGYLVLGVDILACLLTYIHLVNYDETKPEALRHNVATFNWHRV